MKKNKVFTNGYFQFSGDFATDGRVCVLQYGFFRYGAPFDLLVESKQPFQYLGNKLEFTFKPHDISKLAGKKYVKLFDTELVHMKFNDAHRKFVSQNRKEFWYDNRYFEAFANMYHTLYICEEAHMMKITMSVNGKEEVGAFLMGLKKDRQPPALKFEGSEV